MKFNPLRIVNLKSRFTIDNQQQALDDGYDLTEYYIFLKRGKRWDEIHDWQDVRKINRIITVSKRGIFHVRNNDASTWEYRSKTTDIVLGLARFFYYCETNNVRKITRHNKTEEYFLNAEEMLLEIL
jgi:hypothetical protein